MNMPYERRKADAADYFTGQENEGGHRQLSLSQASGSAVTKLLC